MRYNNREKPKDNLLKYKNEIIKFSGVGVNLKKKFLQKRKAVKTLNRKELRKLSRQLKHEKNLAFQKKVKVPTLDTLIESKTAGPKKKDVVKKSKKKKKSKKSDKNSDDSQSNAAIKRKNELLKFDDERDDMEIKKLEKLLHIKKDRKNYKQSFYDDGLDDLLDFTDKEKRKSLMQDEGEYQNAWVSTDDNDNDAVDEETIVKSKKKKEKLEEINKEFKKKEAEEDDDDDNLVSNDEEYDDDDDDDDEEGDGEMEDDNDDLEDEVDGEIMNEEDLEEENQEDDAKEDIYGRLIDFKGNVIKQKIEINNEDLKEESEESRIQLNKQLKGLFNRLTTSNMHTIVNELTRVYYSNKYTRNQLINAIFDLLNKSLIIKNNITPERILCEHAAFVCILSTHIGNDFNIKILEKFLNLFIASFTNDNYSIDVKILDNLLIFLCFLYNFKLFSSKLIFSIINEKLLVMLVKNNDESKIFIEKFIELIVHILTKIGFQLRKDNPNELKNLIDNIKLSLSKLSINEESSDIDMRLKFMLESLNAIKNNNIRKLSGYNPELCEGIFKQVKILFNTNNSNITQLNITLNDFIMSNNNGKWWIVGSAWSNNSTTAEKLNDRKVVNKGDNFNEKLLALAKKQHMNTDVRRNVFCIILSAEDFADAFSKLMKLSLKKQQEREIIYVIVHCLLNEKHYNPYYSYLLQKFCEYDRRFKMTLQFHTWDKFKLFTSMTLQQISNFANLYAHLISAKCMSLSILKNVSFGEMDKILMSFLRGLFTKLFETNTNNEIQEIFIKITTYPKLVQLRQALKLFISHFIMSDKGKDVVLDDGVRSKCELALKCLTINFE